VSSPPFVSVLVAAVGDDVDLPAVLPPLPAEVEVVLVVDGRAPAGLLAEARALRPGLVPVTQTRRGPGNALACGLRAARGDVVVLLAADGSADPATIPRLVGALTAGADLARASRFLTGGGSEDLALVREVGDDLLNLVANVAFRTRATDFSSGYVAFWRDLAPVLDLPDVAVPAPFDGHLLPGDGPEVTALLASRFAASGARVVEVPTVERRRRHGGRRPTARARALWVVGAERRRVLRRRRGDRTLHRALVARPPRLVQDLIDAT
jgi:glycosyltransferase involved in cell wall biosynthesis